MIKEHEKFEKLEGFIKKAFEEITTELVETEYTSTKKHELKDDARVAVIIGIAGITKGRIILESDFETVNNFAITMNGGSCLDEPKDKYLYIAEFANIFCGRATTYINNEYKNREFWLTPPVVFAAKRLGITSPTIHSESTFYKGVHGGFLVDIGIKVK